MTNHRIILNELEYHLDRARVESGLAHICAHGPAFDSHFQLAELHLQRASLLRAVQERSVGNVSPLRPNRERELSRIRAAAPRLEACAD